MNLKRNYTQNFFIRALEDMVEILVRKIREERNKQENRTMQKIRFVQEEDDGKLYMITNYRKVNGVIIFSKTGKCWKFPIKKRRAA